MNQYFIKRYIDKLSIYDIQCFARSQNVQLNDQESSYILKTIKSHYQELLYGNPTPIFEEAKKNLSEEHFKITVDLYHFYKQKYQAFL